MWGSGAGFDAEWWVYLMVVEWLMGLLGLPRLNSETKWIHSHREVSGLIKGKRMETGSLYPCFFLDGIK